MMQQQAKRCERMCARLDAQEHHRHARLVLVGIDYKSASIQEREPMQLTPDDIPRVDDLLISFPGVLEAATVSTCNRIEFYMVVRSSVTPFEVVVELYRTYRSIDVTLSREMFFERYDNLAVRHLARLTAGLNSMVLGETQIFGQVKKAYSTACSVKSAGKILHRLFHQAFRAGKRVREETIIGKRPVSVGGVAARLISERVPEGRAPRVLFIGASEMISLAAEHLRKVGFERFIFANRTVAYAERLASAFGGNAITLEQLGSEIADVDVVVSCTGSSLPVVTKLHYGDRSDGAKAQLVIDLGVPRDIDFAVRELPAITVYDLDDIHRELNTGMEDRESAIVPAEAIVEDKVSQFVYWYEAVRLDPMYNGLGDAFERIRVEELMHAKDEYPPSCSVALDEFSIRLARRLLQAAGRHGSGE